MYVLILILAFLEHILFQDNWDGRNDGRWYYGEESDFTAWNNNKKPDLTMFLYSKDKRKLIGQIVFVYIYFFTLQVHFNNMYHCNIISWCPSHLHCSGRHHRAIIRRVEVWWKSVTPFFVEIFLQKSWAWAMQFCIFWYWINLIENTQCTQQCIQI